MIFQLINIKSHDPPVWVWWGREGKWLYQLLVPVSQAEYPGLHIFSLLHHTAENPEVGLFSLGKQRHL